MSPRIGLHSVHLGERKKEYAHSAAETVHRRETDRPRWRDRDRDSSTKETEMRGKSELIISNKGPCKGEYFVLQLRFITWNKMLILPKYASVEACNLKLTFSLMSSKATLRMMTIQL